MLNNIGKTLLVFAALLLLVLLVTACQTRTTGIAGSDVCLIWQSQTYSASEDSEQTVREVREQNARRAAYCGT